MSAAQQDTERAKAAVKAIIGDRLVGIDNAAIMVTAEHALATLLIVLYGTPGLAAKMLNEGLVPGTEERLASFPLRLAQLSADRAADRAAVEAGAMALKDYIAKWGDGKKGGDA